jgi:zinc transport system ATP-binding protein
MTQQPHHLLTAQNVSVTYGKKNVLDNINLSIERKQIITIVGPNGSGKSTLLKVLLGLIKPSQGRVSRDRNIRIGYLPQRFSVSRSIPISVERFLQLRQHAQPADISYCLNEVHAAHLRDKQLHHLSGGELQRVMLARALLASPNLLVLDEPAQGLDINGEIALYKLLEKIHLERQCSILLVSHNLHMVFKSSHRIICLYHHICCTGKPTDIVSHPEFNQLFGAEVTQYLSTYQHHHDHQHKDSF